MRWPFRYKQHPSDREGIEKAKFAESIAAQISTEAGRSAQEHRDIQRRNHLAPKIHKALGGH